MATLCLHPDRMRAPSGAWASAPSLVGFACKPCCVFYIYFYLHVISSFAPLPQREEDPITVFMGVPTMYSYLLNAYDAMAPEQQAAARAAAGRLRLTVSGSAACPLPVMQRWEELSGPGSLTEG